MLKNLSRIAQNTKINRIFVHVKATYCSHKPTILKLNIKNRFKYTKKCDLGHGKIRKRAYMSLDF